MGKLLLFLMILTGCGCFAAWIIFSSRGMTLIGHAEVIGHHCNRNNYFLTFRLTDGEELELSVFKAQYDALQEGMTGELTWCGNSMGSFTPDSRRNDYVQ